MKVGILTLTLHTNYGGILQAYALQQTLERLGHNVVVLDKDRDIKYNQFRLIMSKGKFYVKKYLLGRKIVYKSPDQYNKEVHEREQYTRQFINKYIHTRIVNSINNKTFDDVEAIIVGSDQVWRPRYFKRQWKTNISNAFLHFARNRSVKKISYGASFGTDDWEYSVSETKDCTLLLQNFNAVSVRESTAIQLCREKLNRMDAVHVLDPTMLLSKEDYIRLVEESGVSKSQGDLMCYVLDPNEDIDSLIKRIAEERKLTPFYTTSQVANIRLPNKMRIQPPLESWLRGFIDAEFVITDSFHACVFSILFGKPFVVIGNKSRGMSRFSSLLEMFSLQNNLLLFPDDYNPERSYDIPDISYENLDLWKRHSLSFLENSLNPYFE